MDKHVFDITIKIRNQKEGMTTTKVNDVVGKFFVKLCGNKTKNHFLISNYL